MTTRAFLGTGLLGTGMAEGALSRGDAVHVWNRTPERAEPLRAMGATVHAEAMATLPEADVVHLVLTHDDAVDAVLDAVEPALSVLVERRVVMVDHSTTSPAGTAARVERMQARGVPYLHAPVFMSPNAARSAQGTMIVAGDPATFERVAPLLEPMTATLRHVGARADLAAAMKLFGNAMNLAMLHGLADILTMARELEIPEERALDVFSVIDVRYVLEGRGRKMAAQDVAPLWTVDVARKDLGLMMRCAGEAALPSLSAIAATLDARRAAGEGELDVAVIGRRRPARAAAGSGTVDDGC
ncbi:MAG: NAD(P)-dependent oxidoreductase [Sandaracinaceae bacterium]|nr:NAD(P)-dependent oxidoreductase [Sandaracinaceae bacterium]